MFQAEGMASRMDEVASRNEDGDLEDLQEGWCGCSMRAEDRGKGRQESKAGLWTPGSIYLV